MSFRVLEVKDISKWNSKRHGKSIGKVILVQAWTGPEVSRRLRLTSFKKIGL